MGVGLPSGVMGTFWNSMALVVSAQCCECTHVPNGKFCSVYSTTIKKKRQRAENADQGCLPSHGCLLSATLERTSGLGGKGRG